MTSPHALRYACGPLEVEVACESEQVRRKITDTLELYNVPWPEPLSGVSIDVNEVEEVSPPGAGAYLTCARMLVDREPDGRGLRATFRSGSHAMGNARSARWTVSIPSSADDFWTLIDLESLVSLVLTEGWRHAGWVPVHAGAVARNGRCALICAESGGGKTTLTAALIRRGWQTLGDDKLLLRRDDLGAPELRALVHTFNLHPRSRTWFPELGDLEDLPVYSGWTEKRKVDPETIWSGVTLSHAAPTHLLNVTRNKSGKPIEVSRLDQGGVLSTLLHQTVIPSDPGIGKQVLDTVAAVARTLEGFSVDLGDDVYASPDVLALIDEVVA